MTSDHIASDIERTEGASAHDLLWDELEHRDHPNQSRRRKFSNLLMSLLEKAIAIAVTAHRGGLWDFINNKWERFELFVLYAAYNRCAKSLP